MKEAIFYSKLNDKKVKCELCPHYCVLENNQTGICIGRKNIDGKLIAINYGEIVSLSVDPIEKKPLFHFYPGSKIFSTATFGCNMRCPFCQNYSISQYKQETNFLSPEELFDLVKSYKLNMISFTYTEPLIWFEYIYDFCKISEGKLKIVLVTNGMINEKPLLQLLPYLHALNVDLKSMNEEYYKKTLKGDLPTVKRTIEIINKRTHIEITNLLIPDENDSDEDIENIINYVSNLNKNIPLHFSRYFPHFKYNKKETSIERLFYAYNKAKEKINYVYLGNTLLEEVENTYCPECKTLLIERQFYRTRIRNIKEGRCSNCGRKVDIIL